MRFASTKWILLCGLLLGLAAFPVFGQEDADLPLVAVNKRPLMDFGRKVRGLLTEKKIDLGAPYGVEMRGTLDQDGKLAKTAGFTTHGDANMIGVVKDGMIAINDSGFLGYFGRLGLKELVISAVQDETNFSLMIRSKADSPKRATRLKNTLSIMLSMAKLRHVEGPGTSPELELLKNLIIETEGEKIAIKYSAPKASVQTLIYEHMERMPE